MNRSSSGQLRTEPNRFRSCNRDDRVARGHSNIAEMVTSLVTNRDLEIIYQPAIRLDARRVEFFEALTRFVGPRCEAPDFWFAAAAEAGLESDLEILAIRCALDGFCALPSGAALSVNISPNTVLNSDFLELLESSPLDRLVLEITEKKPVQSYEAIVETLEPFRNRGLKIAVDDAGAGYSSFRHILDIRPDIIKLDMSICRGIHQDHMRRALTSALISFARQIGCELVAEGVETLSELKTLRALGMTIVQGHILARPMKPNRMGVIPVTSSLTLSATSSRVTMAA